MRRSKVLQGVRSMRFDALVNRRVTSELLQVETAELLVITERTFRRWRNRFRDQGADGLMGRRLGKPSAHRKRHAPRPMIAKLLHQDGSRHARAADLCPLDLIVTMDDAASAI